MYLRMRWPHILCIWGCAGQYIKYIVYYIFFLFNYYIDLSFDTFVFDTRFAARKLLL